MGNRFAEFLVRRRAWVLGATLLVTLFFGLRLKDLSYDNRLTQWIPEEDESLRLLLDTGRKFGANDLVLVMVSPRRGDAFSRSFLQTVKDLTLELREKPHVFHVTSLATVASIEKSGDMLEVKDFLESVPESPAALAALKRAALGKESFVNNVLSADGRWLALAVYLESGGDAIRTFREEVRPLVEARLGQRAEVRYSGVICDAYFADTFVASDLMKLVPLIAALVMLVLFYSFRNKAGVVYPLLVVGIASVWVFGFMALFRWKMTLITPAVPVLLIALGSEYGIHLVDRLLIEADASDPQRGVKEAVRQVSLPILLAALTTIGGFLSFLTAKLKIIKDFGILSAWGILFAFIVAMTFIPAARAASVKNGRGYAARRTAGFTRLVNALTDLVLKRHRLVLLLSLAVFVFFLLWIPRIEREVNFTEYYPQGSPPRQGQQVAEREFGGSYPLTLFFQSGGKPGPEVKSAGLLRLVRRASNALLNVESTGTPFSVTDFIQELNFQLNGFTALPDTDRGVSNLWFFLEGRRELRQFVTDDASECLVVTKCFSASTRLMKRIHAQVDGYLEKEFSSPWLEYRLEDLGDAKRREVRLAETDLTAEEMSWLARRYGNGSSFDAAAARAALREVAERMPAAGDEDVQAPAGRAFAEFVHSDIFPFLLGDAARDALLRDLLRDAAGEGAAAERWLASLRRHVPAAEFDDGLAGDTVETLGLRFKEVRTLAFARRAWAAVEELLPEKARRDENARRKIMGLLAEPADDLAVLPSGRVQAPASGEAGLARIAQSGMPASLARLDYFLLTSQLQSIALVLVITFLLMSAMRKSFQLGFISMVPILITVAAVYGTMGLAGIPLDYATMMIAGVSFGVGIDYTIHFVHGMKREMERSGDLEEAVRVAFREKGKAILANSIAVTMGFLVLLLSSMSPLRHFGGMMVVSMLLAALSSLTTLPALLLWIKPFKKRIVGKASAPNS